MFSPRYLQKQFSKQQCFYPDILYQICIKMSLRNDKKLVKHFKFDRASISNPVYIIPEPNPYFPNTKSQKKNKQYD